jgi:hypothetical protein
MPNDDGVWGGRRIGKLTKASLDRLASARFQDTSTSSTLLAGVEGGMLPLDPHPRPTGDDHTQPNLAGQQTATSLGWAWGGLLPDGNDGLQRGVSAGWIVMPDIRLDQRLYRMTMVQSTPGRTLISSSRAGCGFVACKPRRPAPRPSGENLDSQLAGAIPLWTTLAKAFPQALLRRPRMT